MLKLSRKRVLSFTFLTSCNFTDCCIVGHTKVKCQAPARNEDGGEGGAFGGDAGGYGGNSGGNDFGASDSFGASNGNFTVSAGGGGAEDSWGGGGGGDSSW